jgi:hypothetical protein
MPNVLVVPETDDYRHHVSHCGLVWVTKKLGVPDLHKNNATYLAPFWIGKDEGVNRVFHILNVQDRQENNDTEFQLGNSFVLRETWTGMIQHRKFEYRALSTFGLRELNPELYPGILIPLDSVKID